MSGCDDEKVRCAECKRLYPVGTRCPCLEKADPVDHPAHYRGHPSGIECIEIVREMSFCAGNAIKYIWRAGLKGDAIEDLEKAMWYLGDEIRRLKKQRGEA